MSRRETFGPYDNPFKAILEAGEVLCCSHIAESAVLRNVINHSFERTMTSTAAACSSVQEAFKEVERQAPVTFISRLDTNKSIKWFFSAEAVNA